MLRKRKFGRSGFGRWKVYSLNISCHLRFDVNGCTHIHFSFASTAIGGSRMSRGMSHDTATRGNPYSPSASLDDEDGPEE